MEPRLYRAAMGNDRFVSFSVQILETDVWIGVDKSSFDPEMESATALFIAGQRKIADEYIRKNPLFMTTHAPIPNDPAAPPLICEMIAAAKKAGTGPMAAVAGAFAESIGLFLIRKFNLLEVVVENGGDIFASIKHDIIIAVHAGNSPLSGKIGIVIPARIGQCGICTSSGTVGHSFSYGKADAAMAICRNTAQADAYATAAGNNIQFPEDIQPTLEKMRKMPEIVSLLIIKNDKIGIVGEFEITPLKSGE